MNYKIGDVTKADEPGLKFLPHIVNCYGVAGSGVVCAIEKMPGNPIQSYRRWHKHGSYEQVVPGTELVKDIPFELGQVQFVETGEFVICNMVAQKWQEKINNKDFPAIRMEALSECMERVAEFIKLFTCQTCIVAPKFGSLRAGGDWNEIEKLINDVWGFLPVTIYEYK